MKEGGREEWRREAVEAGETGSFRLGRAAGRRDTGSRRGRRASLQLRFLGVGPCVISTARRVRPPHPASAQQLVTTRSPPTIHAYRTQFFITPPSPCALHWHPQRPSDLSQSSPAWERHMQHAARILLGGGRQAAGGLSACRAPWLLRRRRVVWREVHGAAALLKRFATQAPRASVTQRLTQLRIRTWHAASLLPMS